MSGSPKVRAAVRAPQSTESKSVGKSRQCPICHVYYKYGGSYWQHVRYVHARVLSQCVICEKAYKRTTMVKHHILHSHKIAWHLCSNYVKKIKKSDLSEGKTTKSPVGRKKNPLKYFKKKTLHLISSFNCYNCPESFKTITDLFQHVKTHRKDSVCDQINSNFKNVDSGLNNVDLDCDSKDLHKEKCCFSYKRNSDYNEIDSTYRS